MACKCFRTIISQPYQEKGERPLTLKMKRITLYSFTLDKTMYVYSDAGSALTPFCISKTVPSTRKNFNNLCDTLCLRFKIHSCIALNKSLERFGYCFNIRLKKKYGTWLHPRMILNRLFEKS